MSIGNNCSISNINDLKAIYFYLIFFLIILIKNNSPTKILTVYTTTKRCENKKRNLSVTLFILIYTFYWSTIGLSCILNKRASVRKNLCHTFNTNGFVGIYSNIFYSEFDAELLVLYIFLIPYRQYTVCICCIFWHNSHTPAYSVFL